MNCMVDEAEITLIGYVKTGRFDLYAHLEQLQINNPVERIRR